MAALAQHLHDEMLSRQDEQAGGASMGQEKMCTYFAELCYRDKVLMNPLEG